MAEGADITAAKRRQPAGRKSRQSGQRKSCSRVTLEKVLGITTSSSSGLTSDPNTGLIAYPAGCVIVLLHPKKNKQTHIINTSRKPVSALAFSHDGKHLVSGESGHMPCVRVWEVGGAQVAEVQSHKYGVSCVAFSTNGSYIVSVGYQHDMTVSVWDWKKGAIIASNKVSSRIFAVSFSQDSSYFVTAGNRHVKFWYLDASKERRVNSTVPLIGRSGLLGDHKNSMFSGVACGRGLMASNTYCITSSSLLCLFNSGRQLEAWVDLKTSSASCLCVSDDLIFCGCADGLIRVFSQSNLQYVTTLQRPHRLGVDLAHAGQHGPSPSAPAPQFPGTLALTFDPASKQLTCVYNDHSVYVWDVHDVRNVGKLYSALYHSGCVWNVQVYPDSASLLPPSSFLTCSSDNTIRLWHSDSSPTYRNLYSNDLLRIVYVGEDTQHLQAEGERGEAAGADGKSGIRVLGISPDGRHLAAGDRCGNLRIFGLEFLDELVKIEAHDSEVLCLEFSPTSTGVQLLASASRDRLIHVFNLQKNYSLEQTLNDHSASITAVKFIGQSPAVRMVSCGADKSIYFQKAEQAAEGLSFSRSHHVVEKTTLYDMDLDSSRTHVAIACQDRNIRVYNVETGKLKKCLKGSSSDEGALLKVHIDPSGSFYATSCSDKNIAIFDYESGECVATLFGHSEIVTCMRFSQDCRHLITVSGDSCVFVWRLDSQMTATMRKKRGLRPKVASESSGHRQVNIRRETFITVPSSKLHQTKEEEEVVDLRTPARPDAALNAQLLQTNGKLPLWFRKLQGQGGASAAADQSDAEPRQGRSRWTEQLNPLTICSTFSPSPARSQEEEEEEEDEEGQREEDEEEEDFHPQSLESLLGEEEEDEEDEEEEEEEDKEVQTSCDPRSFVLYPDSTHREFDVEAVSHTQLEVKGQEAGPAWSTQLSPDSACSEGSAGSLEPPQDADTDSLSQGSSVGSLGLEDDEDRNALKNHFDTLASSLSEERFDTDLRALKPQEENHFLNPRLSITTRFLSRFQDRFRAWPSRAPPPVAIPTRISEESSTNNTTINVEQSGAVTSESTLRENGCNGVRCSQSVLRRRASCMISHHPLQRPTRNRRRRHTVVVVQCRKMLGDVGSRNSSGGVVASVQQGTPPRLGYLGTTASSRAKVNQDQEGNQSSLEPQDLAPLTLTGLDPDTKPDLDQDQPSASVAHQATPTDTTPQGGVQRWSDEETPTNHNQTVIVSPAPTITPTATPTACDIITISKPTSDVITCPTVAQEDGLGQTETMIQTGPRSDEILDAASSSLSLPTSCPTSDRLRPPQTGSPEEDDDKGESVTLQQCEQAAQELRRAATRAARLHRQLKVAPPADAAQMSSVLQEAFDFVCSELQPTAAAKEAVPAGDERSCGASCGKLEDDRTVSLLEKYSELLVQMTQNKLNRV